MRAATGAPNPLAQAFGGMSNPSPPLGTHGGTQKPTPTQTHNPYPNMF